MIMHDNGDDDDDDDEDDDDDDDVDGSLQDAKQLQICLLPTLCCGGCSLSQNCQRRFFQKALRPRPSLCGVGGFLSSITVMILLPCLLPRNRMCGNTGFGQEQRMDVFRS